MSAAADRPCASRAGALYARFAALFEYPSDRLFAEAFALRRDVADEHPDAALDLGRFAAWLLNESPTTVEEVYTRTFYISPVCVPYASVHIFGDESFQRGDLMAKLRDAYARMGFDAGPELPDHIGVLLEFAALLDDEEVDDLARYCLIDPVHKMAATLGRTTNPYRHAIDALEGVLVAVHGEGERS